MYCDFESDSDYFPEYGFDSETGSDSLAGSGDGEWSDHLKNKSLNDESSPVSFTEKMVSGKVFYIH